MQCTRYRPLSPLNPSFYNIPTSHLLATSLLCPLQCPPNSLHLLMQPQNRRFRAQRRDTKRVNLRVALRIMPLNMRELRRLSERRNLPVEVAEPLVEVWVVGTDCFDVGLEVLHINDIKPHNRRVKPDIRLRDFLPKIVRTFFLSLLQMLLRTI
jgi:hypothetical protein